MEIYRCNRNCGCMRCRFRGIMWGVVFITGGILLLLETMGLPGMDTDRTWPILLIVIGVVLMLQRTASTEGHLQPGVSAPPFPMQPVPPASNTESTTTAIEVRHE